MKTYRFEFINTKNGETITEANFQGWNKKEARKMAMQYKRLELRNRKHIKTI